MTFRTDEEPRRWRLPDTPFWALVRFEWRRRWGSRRRLWALVVALLLVLSACSRGIPRWLPDGFDRLFYWLFPGMPRSYLYTFVPMAGTAGDAVFGSLLDAPTTLAISLLPACAALAFARGRQSGSLEQYALTRLRTPDLLLGMGIPAVAPVLALIAAAVPLKLVWLFASADISLLPEQIGRWLWWGLGLACQTVPSALLLICIAAACRRPFDALAAGCAVQILPRVVTTLVIYPGDYGSLRFVAGRYTLWCHLALLVVLLPLALRGLRYPKRSLP